MAASDPKAHCTAHAKSTGKRCTRPAIAGGTVCRFHGGSAPQVIAAARMRLLALIDPAISTLARGVLKRSGIPTPQEIQAAKDLLDRAGLKAADSLRLVDKDDNDRSLMTWEEFEAIHERKGGSK